MAATNIKYGKYKTSKNEHMKSTQLRLKSIIIFAYISEQNSPARVVQ